MRFTDDFINKVRDANNLVDILSQDTELKRSGRNLLGLCPFPNHREKTPSFSVSEDKQVFHCFGCKKSGGVIQYLQEMRGVSFREAIEILAEKASIPLPRNEDENERDLEKRDEKKILFKINKIAGGFYKTQLHKLPQDHPAQAYLKKRGLPPETIEEFKLGYASEEWSGLAQHLKNKKAPLEEAEKLGLIRRKTGGHYDLFRERIIFPILNVYEEVVGFGGRILGEGQPKYLNSPESPIFHKGGLFYGLHATAKHIRFLDSVIVVEGYMDLLALYSQGIKNVVATLGTALTSEHAYLIKRYTKNVIVLFDGDQAGQAASQRSLPILLKGGLYPRGLTLLNNMDPDEAVHILGVENFRKLIEDARDLFLVQLSKAFENYKGRPAEKVVLFEKLWETLVLVEDVKLRSLYSKALMERLGVDEKWFRMAMLDLNKRQGKVVTKEDSTIPLGPVNIKSEPLSPKKIKVIKPRREEVLLLNLMLYKQEWLELALSEGVIQLIQSLALQNLGQPEMAEIFEMTDKLYRQDKNSFDKLTVLISEKLEDPNLVTQHLSKSFDEMVKASGERLVKDCLEKAKRRQLQGQARRIAQDMSQDQDFSKLEQFMNIQRERHSLK